MSKVCISEEETNGIVFNTMPFTSSTGLSPTGYSIVIEVPEEEANRWEKLQEEIEKIEAGWSEQGKKEGFGLLKIPIKKP